MDDWEVITNTQKHDNIEININSDDACNEESHDDFSEKINTKLDATYNEESHDDFSEEINIKLDATCNEELHDACNKNEITDKLLNNTSNTSEMWSSSSDEESNYYIEPYTNREYRSLINNGNKKNYKTFENKDKYNKSDDTMVYLGLGITIIIIIGVYNLVKL